MKCALWAWLSGSSSVYQEGHLKTRRRVTQHPHGLQCDLQPLQAVPVLQLSQCSAWSEQRTGQCGNAGGRGWGQGLRETLGHQKE